MDADRNLPGQDYRFSQVIRAPKLRHEVTTYEAVAQECSEASSALANRGIAIHSESELGKLFRHATRMAQMYVDRGDDVTILDMVRLTHASRIASAIIAVQFDPGAQEALKRITRDSLNLSRADMSAAKDALWELELAARIGARGAVVVFKEPDLVIQLATGPFGLACKRVNSIKGVETSLRKGLRQIANAGVPGGVAFSIDALAAPLSDDPALSEPTGPNGATANDLLLVADTPEVASNILASQNERFIRKCLLKSGLELANSECSMVFVSSSCAADIPTLQQRLNTFHQVGVWLYRGDQQLEDPTFQEVHRLLSA